MKEFKFENNTLAIEFGGVVFHDIDPALCQVAVARAQAKLTEFNNALQCAAVSEERIENTISDMIGHVEEALGAGSVGEIMKAGRKTTISLHDVVDIVIYMRAAAIEFEKKKETSYREYSSYPQNRAQRRNKKK